MGAHGHALAELNSLDLIGITATAYPRAASLLAAEPGPTSLSIRTARRASAIAVTLSFSSALHSLSLSFLRLFFPLLSSLFLLARAS